MANNAVKKDFSSIALGFLSPVENPPAKQPNEKIEDIGEVAVEKKRGGRPLEHRPMVRFSLYIDQETASMLRKRSEDTEVPVNKIMLRALKEYLRSE